MDPPTIPQLAVPVTVPHTAYANNVTNLDPIICRIGCLVLVAFYFLLRVKGYTKPRFVVRNGKKAPVMRTKQSVVGNIGFFKYGVVIPGTSSRDVLLTADLAVMKILNQKMGGWYKPSTNIRQRLRLVRYPRWRILCTTLSPM